MNTPLGSVSHVLNPGFGFLVATLPQSRRSTLRGNAGARSLSLSSCLHTYIQLSSYAIQVARRAGQVASPGVKPDANPGGFLMRPTTITKLAKRCVCLCCARS